ncbi:MAG: 1-deoxy-D-xylulose-5-phosphate synthase [Armatimonadetes bacterium]|nr:1-deoxy-D-xylulose-5-phosphate synthase [Armatimonadota bacterium]
MRGRLRDIHSPSQLKGLSAHELRELADEIRDTIIRTVAETGGHLASNLGVVELTLALHTVLDSPRDKIVWDVGHQCYTHKLLTGRSDRFCELRQYRGMSGFTLRSESEHDCYGAGHGSTSISAALGLAKARDLRKSSERIVAVIGDGALTGGLAFEGLNQAGDLGADLTVVLNDNNMSIAGNVGALSSYLAMIRANVTPAMRHAREEVTRMLERIPMGQSLVLAMDRFRDGVKGLVIPEMLFEHLGFTYLGPIDGHNIEDMIDILSQAVRLPGPVMVHAVTCKGKGYTPAEENPRRFHSAAPFDPESGAAKGKSGRPKYSSVFGETLAELGGRDDSIVAITAAMLDGTGIERFNQRFPQRTFDVGLAEEHAVVFAAGLAAAGMRPVVAVYSTFLQRAYDQIIHDVCLQNLPVVFALDRAGLVGDDGPTHHGVFDLSYLRHIPNMTVMAPADEAELRDMLLTALTLDGPAALRYPRGEGVGVNLDREPEELEVGRAEVRREGGDVTLLAIGSMVQDAMAAAEKLAADGIEATVVNARFVKPLDEELIVSLAQSTGAVVCIEENVLAGGFGSAVLELLEARGPAGTRVRRLGFDDHFVPAGDRSRLLALAGMDPDGIAAAARELVRGAAPGESDTA